MRADQLSLHFSSYPLFFHATATSNFRTKIFLSSSNFKASVYSDRFLCQVKPKHKPSNCSNNDCSLLDTDDDDDGYVLVDEGSESLSGDGVYIEIKKLGRNSRRIRSKIEIAASLDTVWNILTDYEKLVDFIPGLAVSELVEKRNNFARIFQVSFLFLYISYPIFCSHLILFICNIIAHYLISQCLFSIWLMNCLFLNYDCNDRLSNLFNF